jgi:hypothetical protein
LKGGISDACEEEKSRQETCKEKSSKENGQETPLDLN